MLIHESNNNFLIRNKKPRAWGKSKPNNPSLWVIEIPGSSEGDSIDCNGEYTRG